MTAEIERRWKQWTAAELEDEDLTAELAGLQAEAEILERFGADLEFGTGGLRGIIGAGTNRLNIYTIGKATEGYARYLKDRYSAPSVAVAYDSRIKSDLFARRTAEVLAAHGITVHLFGEPMPTPALSFAVRHLGCSGGVVITASHNPSQYNGYKVYGADGGQITVKAAAEILERIRETGEFETVRKTSFDKAQDSGIIRQIRQEVISAYLTAVSEASVLSEKKDKKDLRIVYTPLNGTGLCCVTKVLRQNGYESVVVVEEQKEPDGRFPTCSYPNPEEPAALALGLEYMERTESDILLATDPDSDRMGIAVRTGKGPEEGTGSPWRIFTGNETGILLLDYICSQRRTLGTMPEHPVFMKTIVTTGMAEAVAAHYGVETVNVLTGFKYIGEQIGLLEQKGQLDRYLFGFEESYGYLSGTYVRDKDGVNACLLVCEMAQFYKDRGRNLAEVLEELYCSYGFCLERQKSYQFEGISGSRQMEAFMEHLRQNPPISIAGRAVESISDYLSSETSHSDGRVEIIGLPKSNVLKFVLSAGSTVVVRPSGTEPKLKLYLSVQAEDRAAAERQAADILAEIGERVKS